MKLELVFFDFLLYNDANFKTKDYFMKNTHHFLSGSLKLQQNISKKCVCVTSALACIFIITSVNAAINKDNITTVLTAVAANTEYTFSGNVKTANQLTLNNNILNIAKGKTLKLNDDLFVQGENSTINASTIDLNSQSLTVFKDSTLTLTGSAKGGNINLAGTVIGSLKNSTLNLTDKNADFSNITFNNVALKISTTDYDVTNNIGTLLGLDGITNINLENSDSLKVNAGSTLNLGSKPISGGVIDLAGTITGNLHNTTLNIMSSNADFSEAALENVNLKVSNKDYNFYSLLNEQNAMREGITTLTLADENFSVDDMQETSQKFSGKVDNLTFENGIYNITESIQFNNDTLALAGGQFTITNADLENFNNFSITGGTITAASESRDNGIWASNLLSISGGNIAANGFEFSGHGGVEISGGTLVLENDSEIATNTEASELTPYINISGGNITLNQSHLLSRSDIETKGVINITGGNLTVNEGFIGAFNYSDGGLDGTRDSEGGNINISGGTITFNGGNSIYDPTDWMGDDETGNFIANEILAQNINVSGNAQINISQNANLKTTVLTRTDGEDTDFSVGASTIKLSDNASLNLSGALRANIDKGSETAGTLNINDSNAKIVGNIGGVNLAINSDFATEDHLNGIVNDLGDVTLAAGKTLDLTLHGDLTSYDEDLNIKSLTMGNGSILKITTSDYEEDTDRDLEANGPIYATGTIEINHGGLKLDSGDTLTNFNMENANATIYDGDFVARSNGADMNIKHSNINAEYAMIEKVYNGNLNITNGSIINLSTQDGQCAAISKSDTNLGNPYFMPQNPTGDINIIDSIINMNAHSAILRGDSEFDIVDDQLVFDENIWATGNGSININHSTVNMNDHSVMAMNNLDSTQGTINIQNGSILNVNGENKILTDAIIEATESVININQDSTLSLQKNDVRPEEGGTLHLGQNSILNLFGTLDGNLIGDAEDKTQAGTLNIMTEESDITGLAHWLNIGIQANSTAIGEDIFIHDLIVGNDEKKNVQFTIDGDDEDEQQAWGIIDSLTIKDGATVLVKAETAEWPEDAGEYDGPTIHGASVHIKDLRVDNGATLTLVSTGHHGAEIMDIETANLSGIINLTNGLIEGDDEDPKATISIHNATVNMTEASNMEVGGAITIANSLINMDVDDHGIVSSTSLDIQGSSITLADSMPEEFGNGMLVAYKGFDDVLGHLNIRDGSIINMAGSSFLSGDEVNIIDSELNIHGNNYIISHQDEINVQNSSLTIGNEKTLTVLAGEDLYEIDDEEYPTIVEAYQALNPAYGSLNMQNNSVLNLAGKLYSNATIDNSILNINSSNATINGTTTLSNSSELNLGTNKFTTDTLNIGSGTTVNFTVADANTYGSIKANETSISSTNTTLNLTLNNGVINYDDTTGITVKLIDAEDYNGSFETLNARNNRYGFQDLGNGNYQIYGLGNSAASIVANAGGSAETQAAATAWLDTNHAGTNKRLVNHLEALAQVNAPGLTKAIKILQPETTSVHVAAATSNNLQIANATTKRLHNLATIGARGRSGGDATVQSSMWVQGLHNKSKLDKSNGFSGKTYGIALGFDTKPLDDTIIGIGYAYTKTDLNAAQKATDIESHTAMLYGQQTIDNAFINGIVTYGFNQYDESKKGSGIHVAADYNMDSVFSQVMTGYNFNLGRLTVTPKTGLRYLWTHTRDYTDSVGQRIHSKNTNTFTGVIGTTLSSDFNVQGFTLTPKFSLAGTYDFKKNGGSSTVTLANGASYTTRGNTLERFGIETGIGLNVGYDNLEFGIQYEGRSKKNYRDHTGLINFRYHF